MDIKINKLCHSYLIILNKLINNKHSNSCNIRTIVIITKLVLPQMIIFKV